MPRIIYPHKFMPTHQRHAVHRWEVAEEAELADIVPVDLDLYKLAFVTTTKEYHILVGVSPVEWKRLDTQEVVWDTEEW